jgi:hypothetical protein
MSLIDIMTAFWLTVALLGGGACILANYLTRAR